MSWSRNNVSRNRQVNAVEEATSQDTGEEEQTTPEFYINAVSKPIDNKYQYTCTTRQNLGAQRDWIIKTRVSNQYEFSFKVDRGAK